MQNPLSTLAASLIGTATAVWQWNNAAKLERRHQSELESIHKGMKARVKKQVDKALKERTASRWW